MDWLEILKSEVDRASAAWQLVEEAAMVKVDQNNKNGHQAFIKCAYMHLCVEHSKNVALLLKMGKFTSAQALIRPALDAYGRMLYVAFVLTEDQCTEVWRVMDKLALAQSCGRGDEIHAIEKEGPQLPYGRNLIKDLSSAPLPNSHKFGEGYKAMFNLLNGYTHGGHGVLCTLLTKCPRVEEPDFCEDHCTLQISMLAMRGMVVSAVLASLGLQKESDQLREDYQRIVHSSKQVINLLAKLRER